MKKGSKKSIIKNLLTKNSAKKSCPSPKKNCTSKTQDCN